MSGKFKSYVAEMIGTFALLVVGPAAVCMDVVTQGKLGLTGIALAYGLCASAMAFAFGPVSGGHFNPALTGALLVHRRLEAFQGVFYVVSQLLGAALAGLLLKAALHNYPKLLTAPPFLGACDLSGVGFKGATLLEAIGTFFWASVFYATAVDRRGVPGTAPLALGLTITVSVLAIGPLTGAALNPARAFGPAVATGHWANWFVYWIGPLAGALTASLLFESLLLEPREPAAAPR